MRQRGGEQPRGAVQLSVLRAMGSALAGSARSTVVRTHQIQPTPVAVTTRQTSPADVAHARCGLSVQRIDVTPALRLGFEVFDSITDTSDPVPPKGLHIAKPRTAEPRVGDHDGATPLELIRFRGHPDTVQRRCSQWQRHMGLRRRSTVSRWSSWSERAARQGSCPGSSGAQLRRFATGWGSESETRGDERTV